tara:strand:+ start:1539 stop:2930 length:1392 start_codon:yes stop_codon:yes gene_type:complete
MNILLGNKEIIHFVGIGGIGMSGLAQIMKVMKFKIQGSDLKKSINTENCKKKGIKIFYGHSKSNISKASIIVKSSAIKKNNIEILEARRKKIPIFDRAEMLSDIVSLKKNIVISGSHGKTTTTSLIAQILSKSKLDPTIINGGVIKYLNSNAKFGKGELTVLEADESDGSFLKLPINYSVVTNIDNEHLDFYKNFSNLKKAFLLFINKTPPTGKSFVCFDDKNIRKILKNVNKNNYFTYGFNKYSDYKIYNVKYLIDKCIFDLRIKYSSKEFKILKRISLNLIGNHNILNATAAISVCLNLGIKSKVIKNALKNFKGVERRMTKIFKKGNNVFYDDYAHHPTEIKAILEGIKNASSKKIIAVFQPHRYSRLKNLKIEFAKCFKKADKVILCPVYSAGEKKDILYNRQNFSDFLTKYSKVQVINIYKENDLKAFFKKILLNNTIILGLGAGNISQWMRNLKDKI